MWGVRACRWISTALIVSCLQFFLSHHVSPFPVEARYLSSQHVGMDRVAYSWDDEIKVFSPPKNNSTNVAVCLIVKAETRYIDEWVDYHIALGFKPIFIYDNMETPDYLLNTWYDLREDIHDYVTILHFPHAPIQKTAYDRCIRHDAKNSTFVGLFDVDEFLVLKKHNNVIDFIEDHCNNECGQLGIQWHVMSASLEKEYRPIPITKRNVYWANLEFQDVSVKVILRPTYVVDDEMDWTHTVRLKRGSWVDTNGTKIERPDNIKDHFSGKQYHHGPTDVAQFYHYRWKSDREYIEKTCTRGDSLAARDEFPRCRGRLEKIGMHNVESSCGEIEPIAKKILNKEISKCGVFDDTAWKHLKRLVPKYVVFDHRKK